MKGSPKGATNFSEELLQSIFSQAGDGIFISDLDGRYLEVNPRGCEMLGYSREEILNLSMQDLMGTDELAKNPLKIKELQNGETIIGERHLRRKDGTLLTVEISGRMLSNRTLLGIVRDIGERKLTEQSMRELASQWQATFDATSDAILLLNKDQRILRSNRAMQQLFQKSAEEMAGKYCWEIIHGGNSPIPGCPTQQMLRSLHKETMELQRGDRWLEVSAEPVFNEDGIMLAVIHTIRDMTERKQAEGLLKQNKSRLQMFLNNSPDTIYLLNLDDHTTQFLNRDEFCGYTRSELMGTNSLMSHVHPDDLPAVKSHWEQALLIDRNVNAPVIYRLQNRNGDWEWIQERETTLTRHENGTPREILITLSIITELKRVEMELSAAKSVLEKTFASLDQAVFIVRTENRTITACNPAAERIFGYSESELIGQTTEFMYVDHAEYERYPQQLVPALRAQGAYRTEMQMRRRDGSVFPAEVTDTVILDEHGKRVSVVSVIRDITERKRAEETLRESESKYHQLFEVESDTLFLIDNESGRIMDLNAAALALYGYQRNELLAMRNVDLSAQPDETRHATVTRVTNIPIRYHRKKDGTVFPVEITASHLVYRGRPAHIAAIRDISERKRIEDALLSSEMKFRSLVEQSPDGIIVVNEDGIVTDWNEGQEQLSGLSRDEALGQPIWEIQYRLLPDELKSTDFIQQNRALVLKTLKSGYGAGLDRPIETGIQRPDGTRRNIEIVMYTYKTDKGFKAGSISRDITERKQAEQRLEYLAMHDELTTLPNRQLFHDRLTLALERAKREQHGMLAVMLLDLDNFKDVNDTYGHAYGDQLLQIVAQRLQNCLRKSDTAARMGGDEFTLINEEVEGLDNCKLIAKKVLDALRRPMKIEGRPFGITASIGISLYPLDGRDANTLLRHADIAMYRAKKKGNSFQFYSTKKSKD